MIKDYQQYNLFFEVYRIRILQLVSEVLIRHDPLILALEEMMKDNNQFLLVFDMIRMKIEFTSQRSMQMLGIKPEEI